MQTKFRITPDQLSVGDELTTPGTKLTYRILNLADKYVYNDVRKRWELPATCVWVDTEVVYSTLFPRDGFLTIQHKRVADET